jgi:hypothetical protein
LHHYRAKFSHTDDPILYILMDLGTTVHAVDVHGLPKAASNHPPKRSPKNPAPLQQHIFSIHAAGAYEKTYLGMAVFKINSWKGPVKSYLQKSCKRMAVIFADITMISASTTIFLIITVGIAIFLLSRKQIRNRTQRCQTMTYPWQGWRKLQHDRNESL